MANYTLTYSESAQGWPSFYSYYPDFMIGTSYYNAPSSNLGGTPGVPAVYDWVFSDENGATILPTGFYKIMNTTTNLLEHIQVANGIVVAKGNC